MIVAVLLVVSIPTLILVMNRHEDPLSIGANVASGGEGAGAGSGDANSARGTAERAVEVLNAKDFTALNALACAGADRERVLPNPEVFQGIEFEAELEDIKENGDTAVARIRITTSGVSEVGPPLYLMKVGPKWCVGTKDP